MPCVNTGFTHAHACGIFACALYLIVCVQSVGYNEWLCSENSKQLTLVAIIRVVTVEYRSIWMIIWQSVKLDETYNTKQNTVH